MTAFREAATKQLMKSFYGKKGAAVYSFSFAPDGVLVRFSKPFGMYGQKKIFHSWATVEEIQRKVFK